MFHRILVGVDDSRASREALERAIELVEAGHGRLGLLGSAPSAPPLTAAAPVVMPVSRDELDEELVTWAGRNVEDAARRVPADVPITKLVTRGSPGSALLREARSGCWDLVVVGQTARRHSWPFAGRVGKRLNRLSPTPVLVVHEDGAPPRRARRRLAPPRPFRRRERGLIAQA
jgi:nucleotide-binding universal stress UspA family protein